MQTFAMSHSYTRVSLNVLDGAFQLGKLNDNLLKLENIPAHEDERRVKHNTKYKKKKKEKGGVTQNRICKYINKWQ